MKLYGIVARVSGRIPAYEAGGGMVRSTGWRGATDVPTFFLDADIQGITDAAHAERVAKMVIDPLGLLDVFVVVTPPEDL